MYTPNVYIGFVKYNKNISLVDLTLDFWHKIKYKNVQLPLTPIPGTNCIYKVFGQDYKLDNEVIENPNIPSDLTAPELAIVAYRFLVQQEKHVQLSIEQIKLLLGKSEDDHTNCGDNNDYGDDADQDNDGNCDHDPTLGEDQSGLQYPPHWLPHCDWPPYPCPDQSSKPSYMPYPPYYAWLYYPPNCCPLPNDGTCNVDNTPDHCIKDYVKDDSPANPTCPPIVPCLGENTDLFKSLEEAIVLIQKDLYYKSIQVAGSIDSLVKLINLNEQIGIFSQDKACDLLNNGVKDLQGIAKNVYEHTQNSQEKINDCDCDDDSNHIK